MDFRILGPLEVLDDGRTLALAGSKPRALLALLLLHAGETLTSDRLIDELWGERPPAAAAKSLQMQISRLRKALAGEDGSGGAGLIVTRERGYRLAIDPEQLDSYRFERLVAEGRSELAADRAESAVTALEEALALWRGSPLADLAYEPFAQTEIARLDDLRIAALEQLIEAKLGLGRHAEVVEQLELLIAEHPYREGMRAQLMLALYRCDRQADALQAYQDARTTLVEELGIEPGERLRALERAILAQDSALVLEVPERSNAPRGSDACRAAPLSAATASWPLSSPVWTPRSPARAPGTARRRARHRQEPARRRADGPRAFPRGGRARRAMLGGRRGTRILAVDSGAARLPPRYRAGRSCASTARGRRGGSRPAPPRAARALRPAPGAAGAGGGGRALPPLRGGAIVPTSAPRRLAHSSSCSTTSTQPTNHRSCSFSSSRANWKTAGYSSSALTATSIRRCESALTRRLAELVREAAHDPGRAHRPDAANVAEYVELSTGIEPDPGPRRGDPRRDGGERRSSSPRSCTCSPRRATWSEAERPSAHPAGGARRDRPARGAALGARAGRCSCRRRSSAGSSAWTLLAALSELELDELMDVLNEAMAERVLDDVPGSARPCSLRPRAHQGHAVRRVDGGPADAGPQGGRRGARGGLLVRSRAASGRARAALRGCRSDWGGRQGDRVRARRRRPSGPPAGVRGGGAPLRDRADARRRPARALRAAAALGDAQGRAGDRNSFEAGVSRRCGAGGTRRPGPAPRARRARVRRKVRVGRASADAGSRAAPRARAGSAIGERGQSLVRVRLLVRLAAPGTRRPDGRSESPSGGGGAATSRVAAGTRRRWLPRSRVTGSRSRARSSICARRRDVRAKS